MLNVYLSYKPPSSWRIMFRSGGYPRQFSLLKKFRAVVVPVRGCRKGIILQGRQLKAGFPVAVQSCLKRKRDITGASVHEPRHRNSTYIQTVRQSIYETRQPEHPHSPIRRYERCPQGPPSRPRYMFCMEHHCGR